MEHVPHLVWAAATGTVAYCGHRVAITWLGHVERKNVRDEQRDERDGGVVAKFEAIEAEVKQMRTEMKTFIANQRSR